uniref:Uncharacterized protein n=1 Tax=Arundo donax TaxID=35708 RepID=A0A0A9G9S7_ARUDO
MSVLPALLKPSIKEVYVTFVRATSFLTRKE